MISRILFVALLTGTPLAHAANVPAQKPNIIFVLFDDMGYGQPKCYREGTEFKTPNLDRLAREGMRFTDAHSAASVCAPTRYGVITGRYPSRIGQYGVLTTYSKPIIPKTRLTVAALMKQNGYDTACIGKWHLGMDWGGKPGNEKSIPVGTQLRSSPNAAGFDNLKTDLSEKNDVAGENPDVVKRLTDLMSRYMDQGRSTLGAPQHNDVHMSLNGSGTGKKKNKGKSDKESAKEEALAHDPTFD